MCKIKLDGSSCRESNTSILLLASLCNWDQLQNKRTCSPRSKFFSIRADSMLEGQDYQGMLAGNPKNGRKKTLNYSQTCLKELPKGRTKVAA